MDNIATIEQKYDILLWRIFNEWYEARQLYEVNRDNVSFSIASALMRILCDTATAQDIVDFIIGKQQLNFFEEGECQGEKAS